jgi:hypothetical protein
MRHEWRDMLRDPDCLAGTPKPGGFAVATYCGSTPLTVDSFTFIPQAFLDIAASSPVQVTTTADDIQGAGTLNQLYQAECAGDSLKFVFDGALLIAGGSGALPHASQTAAPPTSLVHRILLICFHALLPAGDRTEIEQYCAAPRAIHRSLHQLERDTPRSQPVVCHVCTSADKMLTWPRAWLMLQWCLETTP